MVINRDEKVLESEKELWAYLEQLPKDAPFKVTPIKHRIETRVFFGLIPYTDIKTYFHVVRHIPGQLEKPEPGEYFAYDSDGLDDFNEMSKELTGTTWNHTLIEFYGPGMEVRTLFMCPIPPRRCQCNCCPR